MPKKPEPEPERSPAEAAALMDATLKRMLASPPVPHEKISGHRKPKRAHRKNSR